MKLPLIDRNAPKPLHGLCVMYPSVGALERIGGDWDWIWIDAQHGDLDFRDVANLVRATSLIDRPGLVRVPAHDAGWVSKVLDIGAAGIIVPMVESLEEARAMVYASKFPPLGNRSYGGRRVIDILERRYYESANCDVLLILQVESNIAVALAEEMASIEGVDGLFLGPDDLLIRDGQSVESPRNRETLGRQSRIVAEACHKHGKLGVFVGIGEPMMEMAKEFGYDLVVGGGDVPFLAQSSKAASEKMRAYFADATIERNTPPQSTLY